MTEILTESFCERCGTRYTFEATQPKARPLNRLGTLSRGVKHFFVMDETTLGEAMAVARSEDEQRAAAAQLEAFHRTFNFCLSCRQYTCAECWNAVEGRCLSCAPLPIDESVVSPAAIAGTVDLTRLDTGIGTPPIGVMDVASFRPVVEAPPAFEAPPFEAPSFEAPTYEAPVFEAAVFEAPAFEAPVFEAPVFEAPAPEVSVEAMPPEAEITTGVELDADTAVEPAAETEAEEPTVAHVAAEVEAPPGVDTPVAEEAPIEAGAAVETDAALEAEGAADIEAPTAAASPSAVDESASAEEPKSVAEPTPVSEAVDAVALPFAGFEAGRSLDDEIAAYEARMALGAVEPASGPEGDVTIGAAEPIEAEQVAAIADAAEVAHAPAGGVTPDAIAPEPEAAPELHAAPEPEAEPELHAAPEPEAEPEPVAAAPEPDAVTEPEAAAPAPEAVAPSPVGPIAMPAPPQAPIPVPEPRGAPDVISPPVPAYIPRVDAPPAQIQAMGGHAILSDLKREAAAAQAAAQAAAAAATPVPVPPTILPPTACRSCGLSISASARFCRRCGTRQAA